MARASKTKVKPPKVDAFTSLVSTLLGVECVKEYRFHPDRMWRFDYAIPNERVAVEIDGGVWTYGRHNRAAGYLADMEKFNAAASLGWLVLKFTPQQQYTTAAVETIRETINSRSVGDASK